MYIKYKGSAAGKSTDGILDGYFERMNMKPDEFETWLVEKIEGVEDLIAKLERRDERMSSQDGVRLMFAHNELDELKNILVKYRSFVWLGRESLDSLKGLAARESGEELNE